MLSPKAQGHLVLHQVAEISIVSNGLYDKETACYLSVNISKYKDCFVFPGGMLATPSWKVHERLVKKNLLKVIPLVHIGMA